MELLKVKTARFSDVVKNCGKPEVYLPLFNPAADKDFQGRLRAVKVMTVHQEAVGTKTDYGEIGYTGDRKGTLLIFPQTLKAYEGKRIVGIKYDELARSPAAPAAPKRKVPAPTFKVVGEKPEAVLLKTVPARAVETPKEAPREKTRRTPPRKFESRPPGETTSAAKVGQLQAAIAEALEALGNDRPVAAYKILQKVVR